MTATNKRRDDPIRILIVDDHPVFRDGLRSILGFESDLCVVGEAADGREAVELARELSPDIVLMDMRMPDMDGREAMTRIHEENQSVRFVALTAFDNVEQVSAAIQGGARAFVVKDAPPKQLYQVIRKVDAGETYFPPEVMSVVANLLQSADERGGPQAELTGREVATLQLLSTGATTADIGQALSISESTVKSHIASILQKLGVRSRAEAVAQGVRRGLIKV